MNNNYPEDLLAIYCLYSVLDNQIIPGQIKKEFRLLAYDCLTNEH